ncbi:MAG: sodium:solute symporter family protein [Streptosporangiales bacterium]|nr:sodium:solute symporter family protein [Streptosporangiales bacterium]
MPGWSIGIGILVLYLLAVLYLGYRSYRVSDHSLADHAVARRGGFGILVLTLTYAATFHSAYALTGIVGFAYTDGVGFWVNGLYLIPPAFLFWFVGKRLWLLGKRHGYLTLGDFMSHVYGSRLVGLLVALLHTVFVVPYVTIQLTGSGYIFDTMTGGRIPFAVGAAVMLVIMVAYVIAGGLRAVAWTDTVQGIMMFVAILGGSLYVVRETQGSVSMAFERLREQTPEWFTLPGPAGTIDQAHWISLWIPLALGLLLGPQLVIRIFSARSLHVLKWASVGGAVYITAIYVFTPAVAASARVLFPKTDNADQIFVNMLWDNLPVVVAALALAGGFAASMSTADSQIHAVSSTLAVDVYEKYVNKRRDPVKTKRLMYVTHMIVGVAAYYFAITSPALLISILTVALSGVGLLAPAVFGALYWKRSTAAGAVASFVGGLAVLLLTSFVWTDPFGIGVLPGLWGLATGTVLFVGVSLVTKPRNDVAVETQRWTSDFLARATDASKPAKATSTE